MKKKDIGSSFDNWLREEGIYEEVTATAIKRVLARQVEAAMKEKPTEGGDLLCSRNATTMRREEPAWRDDRHEYCRHLRSRSHR